MRPGSGSPLSDHFNRIPEYERAVVLGSTIDLVSIKDPDPERIFLKFYQARVKGPGLIFVLPFLEKVS